MSTDPNIPAGGDGPAASENASAEAQPTPSTPPPASGPSTAQSPEQKLAEAQSEAARLRDQLLRTAADYDNYRKRARREQDDAQRRGRESSIKELLPVFDNLERAALSAESASDAKAVADGVRIVLKQFLDTLEKMGIKRITAVGQPFDPARHEAIQQMESKDVPAGVVLAEVQPGYMIGDLLLRPAMVVVSRGAPESAAN
jgi:molecular chaperone GrpE